VQVTIATSDIRCAGTDADVMIEVRGATGVLGQSALESGSDDLERGRTDHFLVKGPDSIGPIESVRIWHANNGALGNDWHLAQVQVCDCRAEKPLRSDSCVLGCSPRLSTRALTRVQVTRRFTTLC